MEDQQQAFSIESGSSAKKLFKLTWKDEMKTDYPTKSCLSKTKVLKYNSWEKDVPISYFEDSFGKVKNSENLVFRTNGLLCICTLHRFLYMTFLTPYNIIIREECESVEFTSSTWRKVILENVFSKNLLFLLKIFFNYFYFL
jgi:hypothetical protein